MYIAPSCCYKACVHRPRLRTVQAADGNMQNNRGIGIDSTCTSHLVCSTRSGQQGSKEATKTLTGAFRNIQNRDATWHREGAGQPEPAAAPLLGRVPTLNRPLCRPRLELRVVSLVRPRAQAWPQTSNFRLYMSTAPQLSTGCLQPPEKCRELQRGLSPRAELYQRIPKPWPELRALPKPSPLSLVEPLLEPLLAD